VNVCLSVCVSVCVIVVRPNFLYRFIVFMRLPYAKYTIYKKLSVLVYLHMCVFVLDCFEVGYNVILAEVYCRPMYGSSHHHAW